MQDMQNRSLVGHTQAHCVAAEYSSMKLCIVCCHRIESYEVVHTDLPQNRVV